MVTMDFGFLIAALPILIFIMIGIIIFRLVFTPLAPLFNILMRRQKPIQQKREDYDALFIADLKRGAKRNRVPAKVLYAKDPYDPEQPWIHVGRIVGANAESDVIHLLLRRRLSIFSIVLFIPRTKLSDLHSKETYAECAGFRPVNRHYWVPIWGALVDQKKREELRKIVHGHINALYDEFTVAVAREERTAQTVAAMEPALGSGRAPVLREPQTIETQPSQGSESIE